MCSVTDFTYLTAVDPHPQLLTKQETMISERYNAQMLEFKPRLLHHSVILANGLLKTEDDTCTFPKTIPTVSKHFTTNLHLSEDQYSTSMMQKLAKYNVDPEIATKRSVNLKNVVNSSKIRPYSCGECAKTFLLKHHLTAHNRTHTGVRPHACLYCGKSFTHKHCLNTHLLLHSSDRPYQCVECKKSFTLKHHLLTHMKVHSRDQPFSCSDCGRSFPTKRHLVTHCKFHAGERPFICEECGESFAQKDHLVMHSRFHGFLDSFVCSECGATFTRKFELVNHEKLHGKTPYTCPVCNKEFLQKRTVVAHIRSHSEDFTCFHCGEAFSNKNDLLQHSKRHGTSSSASSLICHECGTLFNTSEALAVHVKLHSGDTSLVNDLCNLTASLQNPNLPFGHFSVNVNAGNASTNLKRKIHVCHHCSKPFSTKQGFQQHQRRHPDGTCAQRSHVCEVCQKAFFQKNHLQLHQRQHMDVGRGGGNAQPEVNVVDFLKVKLDGEAEKMTEKRLVVKSADGKVDNEEFINNLDTNFGDNKIDSLGDDCSLIKLTRVEDNCDGSR